MTQNSLKIKYFPTLIQALFLGASGFLLTLRKSWLALVLLGILKINTQALLLHHSITSRSELNLTTILTAFASIITEVIVSSVLMAMIGWHITQTQHKIPITHNPQGWLPLLLSKLKNLIAESIRVLMKILLFSLLLIIPGIYKAIRLSLVPYIVLFNSAYQKGEVDALKHSHQLTRKIFPVVLTVWLVSVVISIFSDLVLHSGYAASSQLTQFSFLSLTVLLTFVFSLYSYGVFFALYQKGEQVDGADISVERT